ncbi:TrkH family potassium uptake protein [Ferrimonas sp. SCSIO 43195]|uniref:TrkH family potassium uptake protein n=1 Tax=Ferrimonas sp. SCSIO 43195 TaxID=2822844 RepID=UPI00207594A1|nr:TrkH family potassium uptake protein [Ferrimonas sp. SCSIO 43195]USD37597.1 TrkH family potassium uptake protein [Ferrimonas sp. SCSIO 43195]
MINIRPLSFLLGLFLAVVAGLMLIPAGVSLYHAEGLAGEFFKSSMITFIAAMMAASTGFRSQLTLSTRDLYLFTTLTWVVVSLFAALPFTFYHHISYTDAFFETMSGITTTGSTVLSGLDDTAWSILIWRSLLQWLGGIGFIVMGVAIFPMLNVGGMRLFRTESSDWSDKWMPRTQLIGRGLVKVYLLLTALCCLGYLAAGMTPFEAINHAMTTLSTGGYSTTDSSMTHFSTLAHWNGSLFMFLGGLPMLIFVQMVHMRSVKVWNDQQVKGYLAFVICASLLLGWWLSHQQQMEFFPALTLATFNLISVVTTTGFASTDYSAWGPAASIIFFFLMFVGACSGSTSGAIKIFRFQLAGAVLHKALRQQIHPSALFPQRYNRRTISEDIVRSLVSFSMLFIATIVVLALFLVLVGVDPVSSLTGAVTAVTNVGPGLGEVIGPAGNFASLPDAAKWALSLGMLLGRLEIITVAVLLLPTFWRY